MSFRDALYRLYQPLSPSLRAELKWTLAALREVARKARLWKWIRVETSPPGCSHRVVYSGTAAHREAVDLHLSGKGGPPAAQWDAVVVSELPLPGSLRVPRYIQPVVPLNGSIDQVLDGYGDKLRRIVRQQLAKVTVRRADSAEMVRFADDSMLRPYALARHGGGADQLSSNIVHDIASRHDGQLDIVYAGETPVACHLGFERVRQGKRYWNAIRFGFTESVFGDTKRLHEVNSVNVFIATRFAKENGFDYYGLGDCVARPDDGLLHWKRRRGGQLDASQCQEWFYVRLPRKGATQFLWNTPLFSAGLRGRHLSLHLGVPADRSDDDVLMRYREMSFGGLHKVILHANKPLSATLLAGFEQLLGQTGPAPRIVQKLHAA
jgi:hypothetical protein